MKCPFNEWSEEIHQYCNANGLNYSLINCLVKSWGKDHLAFLYHDPKKGDQGMLDETPMPVVLWVKRINGSLVFEQTEHTRKYLA